jgi:hypothetical protein
MNTAPSFRDLERIHGVTWHELTELEPMLGELLWDARQVCVTCRSWSDVGRAFALIRNALAELVGFTSKNYQHPVLGRRGAYQVAYWKLYDAVAALLPGRAAGAEEGLETKGETAAEPEPAEPATATPGRRFGRTLGFWLGAIALGTAGSLLGASMPYHHPVARTISVLWWGIFLGCFGGSLGALLGLWAEQTPAPSWKGSEAAGKSPGRADRPALPPGTSGVLSGANRGSVGVRARSTIDGLRGRVGA